MPELEINYLLFTVPRVVSGHYIAIVLPQSPFTGQFF
jgi:hypothetical protein